MSLSLPHRLIFTLSLCPATSLPKLASNLNHIRRLFGDRAPSNAPVTKKKQSKKLQDSNDSLPPSLLAVSGSCSDAVFICVCVEGIIWCHLMKPYTVTEFQEERRALPFQDYDLHQRLCSFQSVMHLCSVHIRIQCNLHRLGRISVYYCIHDCFFMAAISLTVSLNSRKQKKKKKKSTTGKAAPGMNVQ